MNVNLELKPIKWGVSQGCLYCGEDWILVYSLMEHGGGYQARFELIEGCSNLCSKYGILQRTETFHNNYFEDIEKAKEACEKHYRELMLKAFVQAV